MPQTSAKAVHIAVGTLATADPLAPPTQTGRIGVVQGRAKQVCERRPGVHECADTPGDAPCGRFARAWVGVVNTEIDGKLDKPAGERLLLTPLPFSRYTCHVMPRFPLPLSLLRGLRPGLTLVVPAGVVVR